MPPAPEVASGGGPSSGPAAGAIAAARRVAAGAVYEAGTIAGRWPRVALPAARLLGHGEPLDGRTQLVVEGYPRSSNTLAVALIAAAQPGGVRIAHHIHAPAHVLEAVRRGLPVLVLIRAPAEAAVELVLTKPALSLRQALRGWLRFYGPLLPHRSSFVVARSDEIPDALPDVVERLNARFGLSLRPPGADEARAAEAAMGAYWEGRSGPGLPLVGRTRAPDDTAGDAAQDRRGRLRRGYAAPSLRALRERAERLHRTFTDTPADLGGSAQGHG
ncbi:MAG: hypothetical protein ACE14W_11430 [Candidatus Velamenicoccus archaeovorus]